MNSTMQDYPLTLAALFEHGAAVHPRSEVVTRSESSLRRARFEEVYARARKLAAALRRLGIREGDRVATFDWNTQEHLEAYFAVPCMGAVLHTVNIRLAAEEIAFVVNHARDRVVIVHVSLIPILAAAASHFETVERFIVIGDGDTGPLQPVARYEDLLAHEDSDFAWPAQTERSAAALCYTSGTTGRPKGVVYSHRSAFLHALGVCSGGALGLSERDRVLPVVPMFHANAWGLPHASWLVGADLLLPGCAPASAAVAQLIQSERATIVAGVPTVYRDLLAHGETQRLSLSTVRILLCGGAAVPASLMERYEREYGATLLQAWGLTETSPLGSIARPPKSLADRTEWDYRATAGRTIAGVNIRVVDDAGGTLPRDGKSEGEIEARGPWVTASYYGDPTPDKFHDGWLRTGDVGTVDGQGFIRITDRAKDVIKSGGEWISSVAVENALMGHASVREAAVIGVPDEKWGERPLACVVLRPGASAKPEELGQLITAAFARWWLPERWAFLPEIPKTSAGKFDKKVLRARYADGALLVQRLPVGAAVHVTALVKHGRVRGDGIELAYAVWPGRGQPIVGIHGLTAHHVNMLGFADRLEGRRPLLALDLRGRGDSDKPAGPYGMSQHARDVAAAMRALSLGPSVIVAHSMGAYVATALAAQDPELVRALVLVDGGYVPDPPPGVELGGLLELLLAPMVARLQMQFDNPEGYRAFWKKLPYFLPEDWNPWVKAYVDYDLGGVPPHCQPKAREEGVRADFLDMARRAEVEACLRQVKVPVLLVRAEHGMARGYPPVVPEAVVAAMRQCMPQLQDRLIGGTTHYTIALGDPGATRTVELLLEAVEAAGC